MRLRPLLLLLWILSSAGCPAFQGEPLVSEKCAKQYEKCKLPNGPLGVCDTAPCSAGETGPCFKCMPQH